MRDRSGTLRASKANHHPILAVMTTAAALNETWAALARRGCLLNMTVPVMTSAGTTIPVTSQLTIASDTQTPLRLPWIRTTAICHHRP